MKYDEVTSVNKTRSITVHRNLFSVTRNPEDGESSQINIFDENDSESVCNHSNKSNCCTKHREVLALIITSVSICAFCFFLAIYVNNDARSKKFDKYIAILLFAACATTAASTALWTESFKQPFCREPDDTLYRNSEEQNLLVGLFYYLRHLCA